MRHAWGFLGWLPLALLTACAASQTLAPTAADRLARVGRLFGVLRGTILNAELVRQRYA
jgi:hypothetical protein